MIKTMLAVAMSLAALVALLLPHASAPMKRISDLRPTRQDSGVILNDNLRHKLSAMLAKHDVPGYALAIVHAGAEVPVEYANWGIATEERAPMTSDITLSLASLSKAFTASALGLLMDDFDRGLNVTHLPAGVEQLEWSTKLKDVLPDWSVADQSIYNHLSLQDMLSHVSGFPRHDFSYSREDTADALLRKMPHLRAARELREDWSYCNLYYNVATLIIARYTGQPFPEFVSTRLFQPLGMTSATHSSSAAEARGHAAHTFTHGSPRRRVPTWLTDGEVSLNGGAGGVIASARDLARWTAFLLEGHAGVGDSARTGMRPQALVRAPAGMAMLPLRGALTYGLGWFQHTYRGQRVVHHTGDVPGVTVALGLLPDIGVGVAMLCNGDNQSKAHEEVFRAVVDAVLGGSADKDDVYPISPPVEALASPEPEADVHMLPPGALAGTYTDPAYGSLTLCTANSTTAHCAPVLAAFRTVGDLDAQTLYAAWPRLWGTHARLGPTGELCATALFPRGYGRDVRAFELSMSATAQAEFDVGPNGEVRGLGLTWADFHRERRRGDMREGAQVWFRRVGA